MIRRLFPLFIVVLFVACEDEEIVPIENRQVQEQDNTADTSSLNYLALGDSYTIGEGVLPEQKWPEQLADSLVKRNIVINDLKVIAQTGWTTANLITAIAFENPADYDIVSLLIGVNNQYLKLPLDQYREEFQQLLQRAIELTKENDPRAVFVLSIPDYGYTPFGELNQEVISNEIDEYNAINFQISSSYGVNYFNITEISRRNDSDLVASDNLHPSAKQYSLWVERILQRAEFVLSLQE